jgi:hypothetical protein
MHEGACGENLVRYIFLQTNQVNKWLEIASAFRVASAQCKNIYPEWLNWPGSLAAISEGAR